MDYLFNKRVNQHWGNRHPTMAPYGVFRCAGDDDWLALAVDSDEAFAALCREMGQPGLASDERFADAAVRHDNQDALEPIVAAWIAQHGQRDLMERLQAAGVMAAMVYEQAEMFDDPHLKARGFFIELEGPEVPVKRFPGPMAHFERMPLAPPRGPAPTLGQHNREVFQGILGIDDEGYQHLVDSEIIGDAYLESATSA
jgi:benzylsuccinate CoA-transferase BbsF subunit